MHISTKTLNLATKRPQELDKANKVGTKVALVRTRVDLHWLWILTAGRGILNIRWHTRFNEKKSVWRMKREAMLYSLLVAVAEDIPFCVRIFVHASVSCCNLSTLDSLCAFTHNGKLRLPHMVLGCRTAMACIVPACKPAHLTACTDPQHNPDHRYLQPSIREMQRVERPEQSHSCCHCTSIVCGCAHS